MTDDIRITNVDTADNREWLITGEYVRIEKANQGRFQAHTYNRTIVAMCKGSQIMDIPIRVTWHDARTPGFRTIALAVVL